MSVIMTQVSVTNVTSQSQTFFYRGADKSLARPGRKQATATKLVASHSKKIQKAVRPTGSPRQQWPPRQMKNCDLSIVFSVGSS